MRADHGPQTTVFLRNANANTVRRTGVASVARVASVAWSQASRPPTAKSVHQARNTSQPNPSPSHTSHTVMPVQLEDLRAL